MSQIEALSAMFGGGVEEDEGHVYGSALNPASLHGGQGVKEIAKPGVKVEVKTNNRNATGGAIISEEQVQEEQKLQKEDGKDIWTEEEVNIAGEERPDDRPAPEYEIMHKQHVGTEDVFLGLSDKDPSSAHCDSILVRVQLPGTKFANVQLDIKGKNNQQIVIQAPNWYLSTMLPYPVNKEKGSAKFDSDKSILSVTLPVIKKTVMDELLGMGAGEAGF